MDLRPHRLRIGTLLGVQGTPATLIATSWYRVPCPMTSWSSW